MKPFYIACCVLGTLLPYSQFVPWVAANGLSPLLLVSEAFGSQISAFAWLDVIVSAVVLLSFVETESRHHGVKHRWAAWVGTLTVGVSLGLPLFLLLRQYAIEAGRTKA